MDQNTGIVSTLIGDPNDDSTPDPQSVPPTSTLGSTTPLSSRLVVRGYRHVATRSIIVTEM